jgi:hypothetical protein
VKVSPNQRVLASAEVWHPGFKVLLGKICEKIGHKAYGEVKIPVYQNAFIAKTEIYQDYVKNFLSPAMEVMEKDEEIRTLCYQDSRYYILRENKPFRERVKQFLGLDYCPLHPFVCERFFSVYLMEKQFNVQYI